MRSRWLGIALTLGLVVSACGSATPTAEPASEGIQVHGDWTLEIYNEDGTLDREIGFSNALVGGDILAQLLVGEIDFHQWTVFAGSTSGAHPCAAPFTDGCGVNLESAASNNDVVVLAGNLPSDASGEIEIVTSAILACTPSCGGVPDAGGSFTQKDVTTLDWDNDGTPNDGPIPVTAGQVVQVTVEISFS